jgi:hypothetical protein
MQNRRGQKPEQDAEVSGEIVLHDPSGKDVLRHAAAGPDY